MTATHTAGVQYSINAARVSRVKDPGDLAGLAAVRSGSRVWLMMYYTVQGLTRQTVRTTTYEITGGGRVVYRVTYREVADPQRENGRLSRYTVYDVPKSLPFGPYYFHASLAFGKMPQHRKSWKFAVSRREVPATGRP